MLAGIQRVNAQPSPSSVTVPILPVQHSGIRGTLVLRGAGKRTMAVVTLRHLPPHARPWIGLKSGRCSDLHHISASTLFLPTLVENTQGTATGTGRVHGPD